MSLWTTMLQIVLSFIAGVYVGTEYECRPYLEHIKEAASRLEKKRPSPSKDNDAVPVKPPAKGWFGWSSGAGSIEKKD